MTELQIDAFILSILAFVVSNKLIKGGDDDTYMVPPPATSMKGNCKQKCKQTNIALSLFFLNMVVMHRCLLRNT